MRNPVVEVGGGQRDGTSPLPSPPVVDHTPAAPRPDPPWGSSHHWSQRSTTATAVPRPPVRPSAPASTPILPARRPVRTPLEWQPTGGGRLPSCPPVVSKGRTLLSSAKWRRFRRFAGANAHDLVDRRTKILPRRFARCGLRAAIASTTALALLSSR